MPGCSGTLADATMTIEQWNTVIGVNLTGQFLCTRAAAREFKRRGVVPSVSQAAGKDHLHEFGAQQIPWAGHANYAASKGGVMLLMKSIAQELAPYFIRVNSIAPGAIRTPINTSAWNTPDAYADLMTLVPYKRIGEPDDIAQAAVWLASDAADSHRRHLVRRWRMTLYPGFTPEVELNNPPSLIYGAAGRAGMRSMRVMRARSMKNPSKVYAVARSHRGEPQSRRTIVSC